ncbi:Myb_DNA-bind_4 domain-containing protein [Cephalotus follicularis]|uniref:Myb_DNA-bind_4 domain-containing protein n=1 Tax=Cephalotus follicularis TaxID=3775 RepID=A0A1Q3CYY8_CEPFO|nr:Myb_DNA-bind_4 domain-containing protein [Cephalotus follicularis]
MLGDSSGGSNSGASAAAAATTTSGVALAAATTPPTTTTTTAVHRYHHHGHEVGGGCAALNSGGEEDSKTNNNSELGERGFGGGNRWPRQETLALLQIRSDMDAVFRDANVKGPLWEEVSRKLAELGYHRSAKKCKEKFENVYKYHKRTKEGRMGKSEGKTYRFFDQLEALDNHPSISAPTPPPPPPPPLPIRAQNPTVAATLAIPTVSHITVPSTTVSTMPQNIVTPTINLTIPPSFATANPTILPPPPTTNPINNPTFSSVANMSADLLSNSTSSTSSDVQLEGRRRRKRKWKDFFESLMKEIVHKQEELQKRFLEAIEKQEHERMVREETWRMQEMARINREREIVAQERSIAAAKDAAVMAFLQKISEQQNPSRAQNNLPVLQPPPPAPLPQQPAPVVSAPPPPPPMSLAVANLDVSKTDNGDQNFMTPSSSRWPKVEVQALINLRTDLDSKYQETGPKGPLWEEISAGMRKLGYNRSSKRCKEKWENINKYFKKVKESSKKRPEDSKTCPYFHLLDALYKVKNKLEGSATNQVMKPENSVPLMVRPEQQWPPQPHEHRPDSVMEDVESEQNQDDDDDDDDEEEDDDYDKDGDYDEEDEGGGFEIVANKS